MIQKSALLCVTLCVFVFSLVACTTQPTATPTPPPTPAGANLATITGYVKDCVTEKPLPGAEIKIEYQEGGLLFTYTDSEGFFEIKVPLGQVTITVSKTDYNRQFFSANLTISGGVVRLTAILCKE